MPSNNTTPTLSYGRRRPSRTRRIIALVVLLVLSCLYFAFDRWGPESSLDKLNLFWAQRRCSNFEWAKEQVVFEGHPDRAAKLVGKRGYQSIQANGKTYAAANTATFLESNLHAAWLRLYPGPLFGGGGGAVPNSDPVSHEIVAFVHERRNPAGNVRIVIVTAKIVLSQTQEITLTADVWQPGTWNVLPQQREPQFGRFSLDGWKSHRIAASLAEDEPVLRLFGGQVDPTDPSKFTIDYEDFYGRSTIAGQLQDNESVTFKTISGVAAEPAP